MWRKRTRPCELIFWQSVENSALCNLCLHVYKGWNKFLWGFEMISYIMTCDHTQFASTCPLFHIAFIHEFMVYF